MKEKVKDIFSFWRTDYNFKTFLSSALSMLISLAFAFYNGFLGISRLSLWNGTICVYYLLLFVIRVILVVSEYKKTDNASPLVITHIAFFVLNLALIVPIAVMIRGERSYTLGLIAAISTATYTTYRIIMAAINYKRSRKHENSRVRMLRTLNLCDALVAILTLQNTMLIATERKVSSSMQTLSIITSTVIWILILTISVASLVRTLKHRGHN